MKLIFIVCLLIVSNSVFAQDKYNLWENEEMPYAKKNSLKEYEEEIWGTTCVLNVTQPVLTIFRGKGINSGKAVIILPGGGYNVEAIYHEDICSFMFWFSFINIIKLIYSQIGNL